MSDFVKGDDVMLEFLKPGSSEWLPVACLTNNSLNNTRAMIESQTKCDPGQLMRNAGSISYEHTFEGQVTDEALQGNVVSFDLIKSLWYDTQEPVYTRINTSLGGAPAKDYYYGTGVLADLSLTAPAGDEFVTFSGTVTISGLLSLYDSGSVPSTTLGNYRITAIQTNINKPGWIVVNDLAHLSLSDGHLSFVDAFGFTFKEIWNEAYLLPKNVTISQLEGGVAGFVGTVQTVDTNARSWFIDFSGTGGQNTFTEGNLVSVQFS